MNVGSDISRDLQLGVVQQEEVGELLLDRFHGAGGTGLREIRYPGDQADSYAVKLHYDKHGKLIRATAGPTLAEADLIDLKSKVAELLADHGSQVGRVVLFTALPVNGWLRYRDDFQVLPVPAHAPKVPYLAADHPFLLEFRFPATPNQMIAGERRKVRERELELLLNGMLFPGVYGLERFGRAHWVAAEVEAGKPVTCRFAHTLYTWDGLAITGGDFGRTDGIEPMVAADPAEYYKRYALSFQHGLDVPSNLTDTLDRFYALQRAQRNRLLRACFWFGQGQQARAASVRFLALISAIEALMEEERQGPFCDKCGRSTGPGPTAKFRQFVDRYAPWIPGKERTRFYELRSRLTHGGTLLHSDNDDRWGGLDPRRFEEHLTRESAFRMVRAAMLGWLLDER